MSLSATIGLAQQLIQCPSITPNDADCQEILKRRLEALGFHCETLQYQDVTNLWATLGGENGPLLVFAGHTDVVPTGPLDQWQIPPFEGRVVNGTLHGRGAADMKGSIAAFIVSIEQFLSASPEFHGRIGLLITSDEEGPARWGTREVMKTLSDRGEKIDFCVVGEPTSVEKLGDMVKVGRRGSLGGELTISGIQGHIAYPHMADNPIHSALTALNEIVGIEWDQGNSQFQPTSLQFSNIHAGTGAGNVIPGSLQASFNIRFSPETTAEQIQQGVQKVLDKHQLKYELDWHLSGHPFETEPGLLVQAVKSSIEEVCGYTPELSTSGGTSDGRFIAPTGSQVVELGPVNATIHQIDEQIEAGDLDILTSCYIGIMRRLLTTS